MNKKKARIVVTLALIVVSVLWTSLILQGCATYGKVSTMPKRENYTLESCYRADLCEWQNANLDSEAKVQDCTARTMECRAFDKYIYCKDQKNRWSGHDEDQCFKQLNQK